MNRASQQGNPTCRRRPAPPGPAAFTLVELLVVVAILALLVSMLLPSLRQARVVSVRTVCAGNLRQVSTAFSMYTADYHEMYPCAADPVSTSPFYWLWMGRGWRRAVEKYFNTIVTKENRSVLWCPGDAAPANQFEATSYAYSMAFYHSPAQIDTMSSKADTYSNARPSIAQRTMDVSSPATKILAGDWTSNHRPVANDPGWWTWEGGRNFVFADGQVRYLLATQIRPARDGFPDPCLTFGGVKGQDIDEGQ